MVYPHTGKSIGQLSVLLQSGALDPQALTEEVLDAIHNHPDQAIFVHTTSERAMCEAAASSKRLREGRSLGVLDGIPVAWKDLFDFEGRVTTAGSIVLASEAPASSDAQVVQALTLAGMVSVGCVNMSEFAFSGLGINPHYGTPLNPVSQDGGRLPGGSSSGSAVAVASGLVPVSIGTDTGGSVRIPAAFNGIVGYKATRGRYAMQGVFPLAKSLDSLGPLCRTVQDAIWIDAAMRGVNGASLPHSNVKQLRLVVPETIFFDDAEPEVITAFEAALERLQKAGVTIRRQKFPVFDTIFALMLKYGPLVTAEAFALHRHRLAGKQADQMDPRVVARTRLGENTSLGDYLDILSAREALIAEFNAMILPGELLVSPTLPHVAAKIEPLLGDDDLFVQTNAKTLRNTLIGNFLDWCGISIPCGLGAAGMPVGLLLSALPGQDLHLLSAAQTVEHQIRDYL
ncbi:amidase [Ochrobactrum chromiisoli]|uniref:Indoleacetamide hydrolase n=1 Tax=Ochrobactrum chromiisoli TaxID=2993941 RepID=A0ABT3QST8_9HYPH|nr:amidase [Ochrobactrum chromiisoli]MCX2698680.1 amidase [Ochrobactrum chromiisoli]